MTHIALFEDFKERKTVFYLHGLGSSPWKDRVDIMKSQGAFVIAPQFFYEAKPLWDTFCEIIEMHKPDCVVGHSFGGLMSYYLSNKYQIPALMFMPAFGSKNLHLQPIPKEVLDLPACKDKMAVIGLKDDVVDPHVQMKALKDKAETFLEPNVGHTIPPDVFEKYYLKFVKQYL